MTFRVQVYGNDVGIRGGDVDFEADTLDEARSIARREHPRGARPTEIYEEFDDDDDRADDVLVETYP